MNLVSCVCLVVSVGLGVDYAAHVALASNSVDSSSAVVSIGPAVINGAFTTFIAVVVVAFSKTESFFIFFKVFL